MLVFRFRLRRVFQISGTNLKRSNYSHSHSTYAYPRALQAVSIKRFSSSNNHRIQSQGDCDAKFQRVRDCFDENLNNFLKGYGGALCVYLDDKCVLDIYGGVSGWKGSQQPWQRDTFTSLFSNLKASSGLTILHQSDKGAFSMDDPVSKYWPEFAQNGKDNITVRDVFSHQSGCCIVEIEPGQPPNYKAVINALERMQPNYPPKQGIAYHTFTIGYFANELTQRVSNMSADRYFEQYIKQPLGIKETELAFTNPAPKSHLYCPISMAPIQDEEHPFFVALNDEELDVCKAWKPYKDIARNDQHESAHYYSWNIGSTGFGNARGLASLSNKILNNEKHKDVISDNVRRLCLSPVVVNEECQLLGVPLSVSLSHFACDMHANYLLNGKGVFSAGAGMSFGFINEDVNIAIGYSPSRGHEGLVPPHAEWIANELFPVVRSVL